MRRTTEPQMSPGLFRPLLEQDTIKKGTKIYKANDLKEVHWQHTVYRIVACVEPGIICLDANDKRVLLFNRELDDCYIYAGDAKVQEHACLTK